MKHRDKRGYLVDSGTPVGGVTTKGDVELFEELVHASKQRLGRMSSALDGRHTVVVDDLVCQIGGHDEVVLHHKGSLAGVHDEAFDDFGGVNTLLTVEIGRGLVDEIDIGSFAQTQSDGYTLQLTTGQILHLLI